MSKKDKRIVIVLVLVILYLVPILVLYTNYRRKPDVVMVSRRQDISTVTQDSTR